MLEWCSLAAAAASRRNRATARGVSRNPGLSTFSRDAPAERCLNRHVDDAHPAAAQLTDEREITKLLPGQTTVRW